jgi:hypothetical protein
MRCTETAPSERLAYTQGDRANRPQLSDLDDCPPITPGGAASWSEHYADGSIVVRPI